MPASPPLWTCTGTCTGEMGRYADRLNEAAGMSDQADNAAKMRQMTIWTRMRTSRTTMTRASSWGNTSALGGSRTPTFRSVDIYSRALYRIVPALTCLNTRQ